MGENAIKNNNYNPNKVRKQTINNLIKAGVLSFVIIALIFILIIKFFPLTSTLPYFYDTGNVKKIINWDLLEGFISLLTFCLITGGLVFTLIEYIQNTIQHRREEAQASFAIFKEINDRLMNPESESARRWIIENLPTLEEMGNDRGKWLKHATKIIDKKPRGWKGNRSPGREYLKRTLDTFDFIGFIADYYWNMEEEIIIWMNPPISKVWERIEVFVEEEAILRCEPDYYESARNLGKYCIEWRRKKRYPKSKILEKSI